MPSSRELDSSSSTAAMIASKCLWFGRTAWNLRRTRSARDALPPVPATTPMSGGPDWAWYPSNGNAAARSRRSSAAWAYRPAAGPSRRGRASHRPLGYRNCPGSRAGRKESGAAARHVPSRRCGHRRDAAVVAALTAWRPSDPLPPPSRVPPRCAAPVRAGRPGESSTGVFGVEPFGQLGKRRRDPGAGA
jgi:hypothetical protein